MQINIITVTDLELIRSLVGTIQLVSELTYTNKVEFDDEHRTVTISNLSGDILQVLKYDELITKFTEVGKQYPVVSVPDEDISDAIITEE